MTKGAGKVGTPALKIEQVAMLCGVSVSRVRNWIEKNGLKAAGPSGAQKVLQKDLVNFLIHYNMPIPAGILPVNAKKILFISSEKRMKKVGCDFLKMLSQKAGPQTDWYTDVVAYGKNAEYKILTFVPDLILADTAQAWDEALGVVRFAQSIGSTRAVALVRRNLSGEKRAELFKSGAHAVIEQKTGWNELLGCLNAKFDSPRNIPE